MRVIEKILDTYFTKKLENRIKNYFLRYFINIRFTNYKSKIHRNYVEMEIKKRNFNDEQYVPVMTIYKEDAILHICNVKELLKSLEETVKEYLDKEK